MRAAALPAGAAFFRLWGASGQGHEHGGGAPAELKTLVDYKPQFFSPEDFEALSSFAEILIPTDETPGAREAHCAAFMDFVLHSMDGYSPATQEHWRAALAALQQAGFHAADRDGRERIVEKLSRPEREPGGRDPGYLAYQLIKKENAFAFYTAREGMIEDLDYRGNSYNVSFPACTHPEHRVVEPDGGR